MIENRRHSILEPCSAKCTQFVGSWTRNFARCLFVEGNPTERWNLTKCIGKGGTARVYLGSPACSETAAKCCAETVAVKVVSKQDVSPSDLQSEIAVLAAVEENGPHENIVRVFEVFEDEASVYIVMEHLSGGELYDQITEVPSCLNTEESCGIIAIQILQALRFLHEVLHVAHRDVKPENIMFVRSDSLHVKLIDFGVVAHIQPTKSLHMSTSEDIMDHFINRTGYPAEACNFRMTPFYAAPEIVFRRVVSFFAIDMWSVGIICWLMLTKRSPYRQFCDTEVLLSQIRRGVNFHDSVWNSIDFQAKNFTECLLQFDPRARPSARKSLSHPWIQRCFNHVEVDREMQDAENVHIVPDVVFRKLSIGNS